MKLTTLSVLLLVASLVSSSRISYPEEKNEAFESNLDSDSEWLLERTIAISPDRTIYTNYDSNITENSVEEYHDLILRKEEKVSFYDSDFDMGTMEYAKIATHLIIVPCSFGMSSDNGSEGCAANIINILEHPKIVNNLTMFSLMFAKMCKKSLREEGPFISYNYDEIFNIILELNLPNIRFFLLRAAPESINGSDYSALLSRTPDKERRLLLLSHSFKEFNFFSRYWYCLLHPEVTIENVPSLKYTGPQKYAKNFYGILSFYIDKCRKSADEIVEDLYTKDWGLLLVECVSKLIKTMKKRHDALERSLKIGEALCIYGLNGEAVKLLTNLDLDFDFDFVANEAAENNLVHLQQALIAHKFGLTKISEIQPEDLLSEQAKVLSSQPFCAQFIARIPHVFLHPEATSISINLIIEELKYSNPIKSLFIPIIDRAIGYHRDEFYEIPHIKLARRLVIAVLKKGHGHIWHERSSGFFISLVSRFLWRELQDCTLLAWILTHYGAHWNMVTTLSNNFPMLKVQYLLQFYLDIIKTGKKVQRPASHFLGLKLKWISDGKLDNIEESTLMKDIFTSQLKIEPNTISNLNIITAPFDEKMDNEFLSQLENAN